MPTIPSTTYCYEGDMLINQYKAISSASRYSMSL